MLSRGSQSLWSERQTAESVARQRIDASLVEHNFRPKCLSFLEHRTKSFDIRLITGAVRKRHVQDTLLFPEREVSFAVQRQSENIGVALKDGSRSVPLVNVEIDDERALQPSLRPCPLNCNRDIVKNAESRTLVPERMMGASRQSAAESRGKSLRRGLQCSAYARERPIHQIFGPREADAPHCGRVDRSIDKLLYVIGGMHPHEVGGIRKICWLQIESVIPAQFHPQLPVFRNREFMLGGKLESIVIAEEQPKLVSSARRTGNVQSPGYSE